MFAVSETDIPDLITYIDFGWAKKVPAASFIQGEEDEIYVDFYRKDRRVFCSNYNLRTTCTTYTEVCFDELDLFNHHYPESLA